MRNLLLVLVLIASQSATVLAAQGVAGVHNGVMYPCRELGRLPAPPAPPPPNYPPISQAQYQSMLRRPAVPMSPRLQVPVALPAAPVASAPVPAALPASPPISESQGPAPKLPSRASLPNLAPPGPRPASIIGPLVFVGIAAAAVFIIHEESKAHAAEAMAPRTVAQPLAFRPEPRPVDHETLKREYEEYQRQKKSGF